jgi:hypothetical protein
MRDLWRRRAASVLEVLGIYLAGPLAMYGLRKMLGISVTNPLNNLTAHATNATPKIYHGLPTRSIAASITAYNSRTRSNSMRFCF